jgi:D-3-phosphoglycerate dehydrogenase
MNERPFKVLISDPVEERCAEILKSEGFQVDMRTDLSPDGLINIIGEYDALVVRSATQVTSEVINTGKKLQAIGRAGAGVDNIDVQAATRRGIIVMNTPGGNTISTAEHTMSLLLSLSRNIPQAHASLQQGIWDRKRFTGTELAGKTIGILGLGKVGREVAQRCLAFDMTVVGYDPVLTREAAMKMNVELVDVEELFRRSDFITVHTPLNQETHNLLNRQTLRLCRPGVRIVNCARGGIIDENALLEALNEGVVAGAALDVFEHEPPGNHPLLKHPHVVATPHLGASTEEAQEKVAAQIARQLADVLLGRGIVGSVNADSIQSASRPELQPYFLLAEKLGKLMAQIMVGKLRAVDVTVFGDLLEQTGSVIVSAVLKGMFEMVLSEPVNYINAPIIAQERGIALREAREKEDRRYTHLLRVRYETDKETRMVSGTVFGKDNIRIVGIDKFHFELNPEGYMLLYTNIDRPGMLAAVGAILAEEKVNIAGVALGRFGVRQNALTIMMLDDPLSSRVLERIAKIGGVSETRFITL